MKAIIEDHYESIDNIISYEVSKIRVRDRKDVKQQVYIRLLEGIEGKEIFNIEGFTRSVSRLVVLDYFRYKNRDIEVKTYSYESDCFCPAPGSGRDPLYEVAELKADIEYLHDQYILSNSEYEVLRLMIYRGKTQKESADIVGKHKSTSSRAIAKLRSI